MVAEHSGFCSGVERAYQIAIDSVKAGKKVFMLGNLVHNKQVVEKLRSHGIQAIKALNEIENKGGILLVSAHGVGPAVYENAKHLGLEIIDTTCPWVKKAQQIAGDLAKEGRKIILVGDKGHPEVKGIVGWSGGKAIVVETIQDLTALPISAGDKIGILAQTTQAEEHFKAIAAELKKKARDVKVFDTICGATTKRQESAVKLATAVDLMLVVGDKMSANTKRLTELCLATGTPTYQIESAAEIDPGWLKGKEKIGLTAGASTPEWVIEEVKALLRARSGHDKSRKD